ncbi:ATP-binding protein [Acidithiobacillus sulfuriphilus]|uniref:ATP-binding protein n=1 Tax=Acidithiobacillus sulfuriphilus TaxID=1867749 RepID=A0ACD5HWK1_9PROT|nr:ATP-binding protein [Acidithiobacillus sulfuriphilus]
MAWYRTVLGRVSTMMTSNLNFAEWGDVFPANRMLGVATLDRLRHGAYRLILDGESYRAPRPLPDFPETAITGLGRIKPHRINWMAIPTCGSAQARSLVIAGNCR